MSEDLLKELRPEFLVLIPVGSAIVKYLVDLLKRAFPEMQGNVVQTLTSVIALIVSAGIAAQSGLMEDGLLDMNELAATLVLAWMLVTGGIAINEFTKNRNESGVVSREPDPDFAPGFTPDADKEDKE